jgi:hypothetical protein
MFRRPSGAKFHQRRPRVCGARRHDSRPVELVRRGRVAGFRLAARSECDPVDWLVASLPDLQGQRSSILAFNFRSRSSCKTISSSFREIAESSADLRFISPSRNFTRKFILVRNDSTPR